MYETLRRNIWATRTRDRITEFDDVRALEKEAVVIEDVLLKQARTNVRLTCCKRAALCNRLWIVEVFPSKDLEVML